MLKFALNLFFPPVCNICGKSSETHICKKCIKKLNKEIKFSKRAINNEYSQIHYYLFLYEGFARKLLLDYKFNQKSYLCHIFAYLIENNKELCRILLKYDIIIPVPMHKQKRKDRGYNQTELVLKQFSQNLKYKCANELLKKVKLTKTQSTLNFEERKKEQVDAYVIENEERVKNKTILIFDDIYTTGSTAKECSRMLFMAKAKKVDIFTIAYAEKENKQNENYNE